MTFSARAPIALLSASALAMAAAGCGGGGSSGSGASTGLAFRVAWEQRATPGGVPGAASLASVDGAELGFEEEIPPSVNAIRFVLTPPSGSGDACCVALLRGTPPFEERRIVLANVSAGEGSLEVNGYPTDFAPADGIDQVCDTNGAGAACSSDDTLPSFTSGEVEIDVIEGITNIVDISVHSLPFLLDLDPDDGETADSNPPPVSFAVVDANFDINEESIEVLISQGEISTGLAGTSFEDCADGDSVLPDCSDGGELEVRGILVEGVAQVTLDAGTAELDIEASNTALTPRSMDSETTFIVPEAPDTTTTTAPSTTTSTTAEEPPARFCVLFTVDSTVDLLGVSYTVSYGASDGEFDGTGEEVECFSLIDSGQTTLTSFNDEDGAAQLHSAVISAETFSVPQGIAQCDFLQVPPLDLSGITIQVTEATAGDLSPASATVTISETTCPF
jgi:hypothetical protein